MEKSWGSPELTNMYKKCSTVYCTQGRVVGGVSMACCLRNVPTKLHISWTCMQGLAAAHLITLYKTQSQTLEKWCALETKQQDAQLCQRSAI